MTTTIESFTETGCYLDNHRGHYITRDVIQLAVGHGFIIGQFEEFAIDNYATMGSEESYPHEGLQELCEDAIEWLNSGDNRCYHCNDGTTGGGTICLICSGKNRSPRISGQNFPPDKPEGTYWSFNDSDFGLYNEEEMDLS